MTLDFPFARPLRRALLTMAMLLGVHTVLFGALDARPELPPTDVDRVEVFRGDGTSYQIRNPAAVARIVAFARERRIGWIRIPPTVDTFSDSYAHFYKGGELRGWISWNPRSMGARSGDATGAYPLPPQEHAHLERLLARRQVGR